MAVVDEYIGHPDLVGGGQTGLHSHSGGGGGADVKSGQVNASGDGSTLTSVSFTTAFSSSPNVVLTPNSNNSVEVRYFKVTNITTTGFDIRMKTKDGSNMNVEWIATDAGNS